MEGQRDRLTTTFGAPDGLAVPINDAAHCRTNRTAGDWRGYTTVGTCVLYVKSWLCIKDVACRICQLSSQVVECPGAGGERA